MTIENIKRAQAEAKRFFECADAVLHFAVKSSPDHPEYEWVESGK